MDVGSENLTSDVQDQVDYYNGIAIGFRIYATPIILFGGTVGNLITVIVVLSRHFRHTPSSILLLALAIVDIGVLYFNLLDIWLGAIHDSKSLHLTRDQGWFGCKISTFMTYFLSQSSSWILVLINIDRVIWMYKPRVAGVWCTKRRLGIVVAATLTVFAVINIHLFWTAQFYAESKTYKCTIEDPPNVWSHVDAVLFCFLPFIIILTCNIALIIGIVRRGEIALLDRDPTKANRSITAMLLAISIVFLITTSPLAIAYQEIDLLLSRYDGDPVGYALNIELVVQTLLVLLCYSNNALNFFLYCLSAAKFRRALRDVCCCVGGVGGCCQGGVENEPLAEENSSPIAMEPASRPNFHTRNEL